MVSGQSYLLSCYITFAVVGLIVGVVGTVLYFVEQHKITYYVETSCYVLKADAKYSCRTSHSTTNKHGSHTRCHYYPYWEVNYFVQPLKKTIVSSIETNIGYSRSIALSKAYSEHPFHSNSSCWYDSSGTPTAPTNCFDVQWQQPSDYGWILMMVIGYGVTGLFIIVGCCIFIVTKMDSNCCCCINDNSSNTSIRRPLYSNVSNYSATTTFCNNNRTISHTPDNYYLGSRDIDDVENDKLERNQEEKNVNTTSAAANFGPDYEY